MNKPFRSVTVRVVCSLIGTVIGCIAWQTYSSSQLCRAALEGDAQTCKRWLFWRTNVNAPIFVNNVRTTDCPTGIGKALSDGEIGEPPLAFAVWPKEHADRQAKVGLILLEAGANPNGAGYSIPLMRARTPAMVIFLAKHGADLDRRDAYDDTALINAARMHDVSLIRALVACGASVNAHANDGTTALDLVDKSAMLLGQNDRVADCRKILLQHGAKNGPTVH